jgi:hypothetical protein
MKINKTNNVSLENVKNATVIQAGNNTTVTTTSYYNSRGVIAKLPNGYYFNRRTGEIKKYHIHEHRSRLFNLNSVKRAMLQLRYIIESNFFGDKNELFISLTYSKPQTDIKRLKKDWANFVKKLYRKYPDSNLKYIVIFEPQGKLVDEKPCFHIHFLLKGLVNMDKKILYKLWPQGFVDVKSIHYFDNDDHNVDENPENIAAYVTSYAVNLNTQFVDHNVAEIMKENKIEIITTSSNKQIAKGARLLFYPRYFRFYSCSSNVKMPRIYKNLPIDKIDFSSFGKLESSYAYEIYDDNKKLNKVQHFNYKKVKKQK